eukprot:scaffold100487_cov23-Tisochrysis_lutea.AAC.1
MQAHPFVIVSISVCMLMPCKHDMGKGMRRVSVEKNRPMCTRAWSRASLLWEMQWEMARGSYPRPEN